MAKSKKHKPSKSSAYAPNSIGAMVDVFAIKKNINDNLLKNDKKDTTSTLQRKGET